MSLRKGCIFQPLDKLIHKNKLLSKLEFNNILNVNALILGNDNCQEPASGPFLSTANGKKYNMLLSAPGLLLKLWSKGIYLFLLHNTN